MPYNEVYPLGGNGDILQDLLNRVNVMEARSRVLQNASIIVQDGSGAQQAIIGQLADGTYGIQVGNVKLNANGVTAGNVSLSGAGLTATAGSGKVTVDSNGLHVYNAANQEEVRAGILSTTPTIYGLGMAPSTGSAPGTLQQAGGAIATALVSASNVTNTSFTSFTGSSSCVAEIGPSGSALGSISGSIGTGTASQQGVIGLSIDGAAAVSWLALSSGAGAVSASLGATFIIIGQTAGVHTFQLQYKTVNNGASNCSFTAELIVQPL